MKTKNKYQNKNKKLNLLRYAGSFLLVLFFFVGVLGFHNVAFGQAGCDDLSKATPEQILQCAIEGTGAQKTKLESFKGRPHGLSAFEPGADILTTAILNVIDFVKYLLGSIAVIYITIAGVKLIQAGGKIDEESQKAQENIKYILYGLGLSIIADVLVTEVFFGEYGECLASESNAQACAEQGSLQIRGIYNLIQAFVGSIAVLVIILSGFRMVTSAGEEEVIGKQKKRIAVALIGLIVIGISEFVVKDFIFPEAGTKAVAAEKGVEMIVNITNFASGFVGTISFVFLIYGGWHYIASFGNPEKMGKAKKIIIGALLGIVIAIAAFAIVNTFISEPIEAGPETERAARLREEAEEARERLLERLSPF